MTLPARGALIIAAAVGLAACMAPMTTGEAQTIARTRVTKYCNGRCGKLVLANTQQIKNRWLVDFEDPKHKFTVTVEGDGNAKVTTWNK